jgi:hypothetical protein
LKARFKAMLREGLALLVCHSDLKRHASIGRRTFALYYLLNNLLELVGTQRIMHVGINLREREREKEREREREREREMLRLVMYVCVHLSSSLAKANWRIAWWRA